MSVRKRRIGRALAVAVAVSIVMSGCSGGLLKRGKSSPPPPGTPPANLDLGSVDDAKSGQNGLWHLSGSQAIEQIIDAVDRSDGVLYEGTYVEQIPVEGDDQATTEGRTLHVTYAGSPEQYSASIEAGKLTASIVTVKGDTYVSGNAAFAAHIGVAEAAEGSVCVADAHGILDEWNLVLDPAALVEALLGNSASVSTPADGKQKSVDVVISDGTAPVGTMSVAAFGPPLPHSYVAGDSSGDASFTFDEWGTTRTPTVPDDVIVGCE